MFYCFLSFFLLFYILSFLGFSWLSLAVRTRDRFRNWGGPWTDGLCSSCRRTGIETKKKLGKTKNYGQIRLFEVFRPEEIRNKYEKIRLSKVFLSFLVGFSLNFLSFRWKKGEISFLKFSKVFVLLCLLECVCVCVCVCVCIMSLAHLGRPRARKN